MNFHASFIVRLSITPLRFSWSDEAKAERASGKSLLIGRLKEGFRHARLLLTLRPICTFACERMNCPTRRRGCLLIT